MKKLLLTTLLVLFIGTASNANAATIKVTLPEYSGVDLSAGPFPELNIGTFDFTSQLTPGEHIVSAKISGQWGNSTLFTSAHNYISIDDIIVAYSGEPKYYNVFNTAFTPWSYDFEKSELSIFNEGKAVMKSQMLSPFIVRLGETTLELTTEPTPAPEPSSMVLGLMGLSSMLGLRRKKA
jgi:hypothetical protein